MTGRREAAACYTTVSDQLNFQLLLIENKHAYPSTAFNCRVIFYAFSKISTFSNTVPLDNFLPPFSSNTLPLSFSLRSKRTSAKDTSPSLRSPDSHIISPACPWRCNKPSEFTGELWERRCKHKTQEYPVYSPAYCTRRPWGFVVLEVGDGRTG